MHTAEGRRLRLLRQAEGISTADEFARRMGWLNSSLSSYETGKRRVPADKALQLCREFPGFDVMWLWTGDTRGLGFDLRKRIERLENAESSRLTGCLRRKAQHA